VKNSLAAAAAYVAALTLAACGNSGISSRADVANAVRFGRIHYALTRPLSRERATPANAFVTYGGGPVLVAPKIYLIFWGYKRYGDTDKVQALLELYTKNMGGSGHNNIYTQYYEQISGKKTFIANPAVQLGGEWSDDSAVPRTPSDEKHW